MSDESRSPSPSAETTQNPPSSPPGDRRKSARVTRKPQLFSQGAHSVDDATPGRAKRKRAETRDDEDEEAPDNEDEDEDASESESDDHEDDDPDEEELREKRRAARRAPKKKTTTGSKGKARSQGTHAAKKPKVAGNGIGRQLALRPATNGRSATSRPKKARPAKFSFAAGVSGLYAEVFAKGQTVDAAAAEWLTQYQRDNITGIRDLINFIIRCAGADLQVTLDDIKDVDHAPDRVTDLQNLYQQQGITDYPLISKARSFRTFPAVLRDFFTALTQTLHHSSVLYSDPDLFENLQTWLSAISTSGCRPFRHTATVISVAMTTALCDLAREVTTTVATSRKQLESEKKKKTVNKGRADAIQKAIQEGEQKLETLDALLTDSFDTIFVHRYRDVDPRIRAESMAGLGQWMRSYRELFFEGQYLRYFGWILSDSSAHTRSVVLAQVRSLFDMKDNMAGIRSFTDRFRPRVVEMAARDADVGVRASAVELSDLIRDVGLIEPEDIDTVGRLVFDLEPRVRKAAGRFFVANVDDVFESTTEEVGEELNELFADEDDEEYESPKRSWIKFKCLVDILQTYDEQENALKPERSTVASRDALSGSSIDSRFILATEAIYPHLKELAQWQTLAGYLLYDHSQIPDEPAEDDTAGAIRKLFKMQEGQEVILLEILCCVVKLRILEVAKSDIDKRGRKVKALTDKIPELQEEIAHNLAQIIPLLLSKYGAVPEAASVVLRLEHLIDLDKIQDLQKDATAYSSLLNDINKQFLTHSDQDVLVEASVAFIHAKSSDEMKEALENKVQELWDDMIDALSTLAQNRDGEDDDSIPPNTLTELANTVMRISNLANVTDCTSILETVPSAGSKKKKKSSNLEAPFNTLIRLAKRGLRQQDVQDDSAQQEAELIINSIQTLLTYFLWKVQGLKEAVDTGKASLNTAYFEALTKSREVFVATLIAIMEARPGLDDVRFVATSTLLDLQTLFGNLRHAGQTASNDEDVILQTQSLVHEISPDTQALIAKIHSIAERTYSKKVGEPLEPADDDAPPTSESDDEEQASDEDDAAVKEERLRSTLMAERRLCELTGKIVLAIIGRVMDASGSQRGKLKERLLKNRSRLGNNYREILSYMIERKPATQSRNKPQSADAKKGSSKNAKSDERVEDEDDPIEDDDQDVPNPEEDEEDDLRARDLVEDNDVHQGNEEEERLDPAIPDPDDDEVMGD